MAELAHPDRVAQIREEHEIRLRRAAARRQQNPLRPEGDVVDNDELYGHAKVCLACHK